MVFLLAGVLGCVSFVFTKKKGKTFLLVLQWFLKRGETKQTRATNRKMSLISAL